MTDSHFKEPSRLYRYRSFPLVESQEHRLRDIFVAHKLYFPSPAQLNDPFDCRIRLSFDGSEKQYRDYMSQLFSRYKPEWNEEQREQEIEALIDHVGADQLEDVFRNLIENGIAETIGVSSLSAINNDILMWGHYADGHRGVCLEFQATNSTPFFGRAQPVQYEEKYPLINFFTSDSGKQAETVLLSKSSQWCYEREWRIIEHDSGPGEYEYPPELLTGVIFGAAIPDKHRDKVRDWVAKSATKPAFYNAKLKSDEFGLYIEET